MRILVISDSHGRNDDIEGVLKQVGDIDMMIHCGDVERGDSYIREIAGCPVVMVAGTTIITWIFRVKKRYDLETIRC